ncbi:MAG TPA: hypothetical protein VFU45_02990, partial [Gemmatimonadales bacterium]|nr:hypothetical protein [Gemmatimonadales bacterium]
DLVTRLLELAGAARADLERGETTASVRRLAPDAWRARWESAAAAAAAVVRTRIDEEMVRAAGRSGFPLRRLLRLAVSDDEARSIELRLSACAAPLAVALEGVARASAGAGWPDAMVRAAQALEVSWLELESVAVAEEHAWRPEVDRIAHWRPARWPRWVAAAAVLLVTGYAGLVLGGYLPVPAPLRPAARVWWDKVEP